MKRAPRLLLVAFVLSLLIHLIIALELRRASPTAQSQPEVVSIQHRPATIAVRKPTPPPPPRPRRTPAARASASAAPVRKGPANTQPTGVAATPPPAIARATPSPAATPAAACAKSDIAASVLTTPAPPQIPTAVRAAGTSGLALVSVQLDASGQVTSAAVAQSTGNSSLDLVAVAMARDARYAPALRDCKPIASAYTFSVKFFAW